LTDTDADLVRRARQGDQGAFARLVERYERPALAIAQSILRSWHDARDAVQDAFIAAYRALNRLWRPARFGAWLMRIVRRQAFWLRRRRLSEQRHVTVQENVRTDISTEADPTPTVDWTAILGRLPEQESLVVSLRHVSDLPVAEIARVTGRPVGTVTKQLSRAYARMRGWLEEDG
jgi:RNA polymerase sigma-70 factor, ECF subfamily